MRLEHFDSFLPHITPLLAIINWIKFLFYGKKSLCKRKSFIDFMHEKKKYSFWFLHEHLLLSYRSQSSIFFFFLNMFGAYFSLEFWSLNDKNQYNIFYSWFQRIQWGKKISVRIAYQIICLELDLSKQERLCLFFTSLRTRDDLSFNWKFSLDINLNILFTIKSLTKYEIIRFSTLCV